MEHGKRAARRAAAQRCGGATRGGAGAHLERAEAPLLAVGVRVVGPLVAHRVVQVGVRVPQLEDSLDLLRVGTKKGVQLGEHLIRREVCVRLVILVLVGKLVV